MFLLANGVAHAPDGMDQLDAELFITDFRPVPLYQKIVRGEEVFEVQDDVTMDSQSDFLKPQLPRMDLTSLMIKSEDAPLIYSAIETVTNGYSALVFCPTKNTCEKLARAIAENVFEFGAGKKFPPTARIINIGNDLKKNISGPKVKLLLQALAQTATGLDNNLEAAVRFGVAFHHAGLSVEERSLIERGFRDGTLRVLCSTTTLSAGKRVGSFYIRISVFNFF